MLRIAVFNFLAPLLLTSFFTLLFIKVAVRFKIMDFPGRRKIHKEPVPLLGGVAIFLGCLAGLCLNPQIIKFNLPIIIGGLLILTVNLMDDFFGLSANIRFISEVVISTGVVLAGERISFLPPGLFNDILEICITLIWLVGLINAFNYLDGIDGLATGSAIINSLYFTIILFITKQTPLASFTLILLASCLGFLPYNFRKAKIFLGDAGSTFLGFTLAAVALVGNWAANNLVRLAVPILILGVPIFDMIFTTVMRIKEGKVNTIRQWLEYSGKDHFHHRIIDLGLYPEGAVVFIYFVNISLGISAIMVSNETAIVGILSIIQASIIFVGVAVLMMVGRRRVSGWSHLGTNKQGD